MFALIRYAAVVITGLALVACSTSTPSAPEPTGQTTQALTTINWSGYTWDVKQCTGCGPGPNNFDSATSTVWVDSSSSLNLLVHKSGGKWYCGEVWLPTALGHGTYEFFIKTRTDIINYNLVNAGFLYQDDSHELDVEWSKWGNSTNTNNGDFAIQPSPVRNWNQAIGSGNWQKDRIIWTSTDGGPDQVEFQVETNSVIVQDWTQTLTVPDGGTGIDPALALVHINNWMFQGKAPSNGASEVFTLASFTFTAQ